jgi:pectate lyase
MPTETNAPGMFLRGVLASSLLWVLGCSSAPTTAEVDGGSQIPAPSVCGEPAPPVYDATPMGWASIDDLGQNGTTGGDGGEVVPVSTTDAFVQANARIEPLVIEVSGTIGEGRELSIGSHKTIVGVGERPTIQGSIEIEEVQNVILRNLYIVGNNCTDGENGDCQRGSDAVRIGDGAHHVWVDHCDVSDGSDGNLDVNGAADYVTISWSKFSYSSNARSHRYSNLIGSGDGNIADRGKLRVTWHHCWWAQFVQERMPRSRFGDVHVLNNYYSSQGNSYCIRAGVETRILAEGNYFDGVTAPFDIDAPTGVIEPRQNQLYETTTDITPGFAFEPPYAYSVDSPSSLPCAVSQGAGPH